MVVLALLGSMLASRMARPVYGIGTLLYQFQCSTTFREIKQIATEAEAVAGVLSNLEEAVMVGPIIRVAMERINISITCMTHRQNSVVHHVVYVVVLIILPSTVIKGNMT